MCGAYTGEHDAMTRLSFDYGLSIADDINDTIRIQYRTGDSFTEQEVETLIEQALSDTDPSVISFSEVQEHIDYNLIGA
jgi:hypothetical protein|tara:strand:- start:218 stop:454 length:237 start_codon:yes stop_codon:yes gene_type:complete